MGAGMLDGSGKFSGVAAKEMEEETGLVITEESVRVPHTYVHAYELRLGFSITTRNPEGILSHNNRKS
jgi:8-oxo-dGTP pyrophosphatase MutT (NUDIX family)